MSNEEGPVAWLRLAILLRRDAARAACGRCSQPPAWSVRGFPQPGVMISRDIDGQPVVFACEGPSEVEAAHIALNDPQDIIARCEAELAILGEHKPELIDYRDGDGIERASRECIACEPPGTPDNYPCRTVRLLASGYRHWPGYREEWKP